MLGGCASTGGEQPGSDSPSAGRLTGETLSGESLSVYVVRPQDTLYSIAWRYGLDYRDLARWNHIGPDFRITVGQALVLSPDVPSAPEKRKPSPNAQVPSAPNSHAQTFPAPHSSAPAPSMPVPPVRASAGFSWAWPTDQASAIPQAVSGSGILLSGRMGQDIRAAATGRVVYSGNGIRAYGNLIIIKHGENWLSAYAHCRESLVHQGQDVIRGQVIAHMGEGTPQKPVLYFEIRRNGKPVDPLAYLPSGR
jgi:lipoprotein NlpD